MLIIGSSSKNLGVRIANKLDSEYINSHVKYFNDKEFKVEISAELKGKDVIILQSTCSPANDKLMELLLIAETAKHAKNIK